MKISKFMTGCLCLLAMIFSMTLSSCGDDDNKPGESASFLVGNWSYYYYSSSYTYTSNTIQFNKDGTFVAYVSGRRSTGSYDYKHIGNWKYKSGKLSVDYSLYEGDGYNRYVGHVATTYDAFYDNNINKLIISGSYSSDLNGQYSKSAAEQ